MNKKLIFGIRPGFHIAVVALFYLISGFFELGGAATNGQYASGFNPLLDMYRKYLWMLGLTTVLTNFGLLFRKNLARISASILAWWNLFTAPIFHIWWFIYATSIKKFLSPNLTVSTVIQTMIIISMYTLIRLYIIYILKPSKAGYLFLKKK